MGGQSELQGMFLISATAGVSVLVSSQHARNATCSHGDHSMSSQDYNLTSNLAWLGGGVRNTKYW